jgi:hypothetical protein
MAGMNMARLSRITLRRLVSCGKEDGWELFMLARLDILLLQSFESNLELVIVTHNIDTFPVFKVDVAWLFFLFPIISIHRRYLEMKWREVRKVFYVQNSLGC